MYRLGIGLANGANPSSPNVSWEKKMSLFIFFRCFCDLKTYSIVDENAKQTEKQCMSYFLLLFQSFCDGIGNWKTNDVGIGNVKQTKHILAFSR